MFFLVLILVSMSACGSPNEFVPDYESAVGVIFVNCKQELPENTKIYADFENNNYSFNLDAACIYYFDADVDVSYAGEQNLTQLTFSANIDDRTVGAEGSVAYHLDEDSENIVFSYYLYNDETGMYFDTSASFNTMEITDMCVLEGTDYSCAVTFEVGEPTDFFIVTYYDEAHNAISETNYSPEEVTDNQKFDMDNNIHSVEITCYGTDGTTLNNITVSAENTSAAICYDNGGQILGNKVLRFVWQ